jgi:hypothetical protein
MSSALPGRCPSTNMAIRVHIRTSYVQRRPRSGSPVTHHWCGSGDGRSRDRCHRHSLGYACSSITHASSSRSRHATMPGGIVASGPMEGSLCTKQYIHRKIVRRDTWRGTVPPRGPPRPARGEPGYPAGFGDRTDASAAGSAGRRRRGGSWRDGRPPLRCPRGSHPDATAFIGQDAS